DRQDAAPKRDLTRHGDVLADRNARHDRHDGGNHGDTSGRTVLRRGPFRDVDVDVLLVEDRRLDAEVHRSAAHVGCSRGDRLLHHVTEVTRDCHLALTGHHDAFDGQQLTANLGPGKTRDHANLILALGLAEAEPQDAKVLVEIFFRYLDTFLASLDDLGNRLTRKLHQFALKVTDTGFPRVVADDRLQRTVRHGELPVLQGMFADRLRQQVTLGNLDLLVLSVTGNTNDLHAVHQGRRNVQRIGRRHEHHVREIVLDLQVVVHEGRV